MKAINEKWQQIAIEIGNGVRRTVNTPTMIGTDDETGYVLMFFNAKHHNGKATVVSSATSTAELKQILENTLREIDGPKAKIVEQSGIAH